MPRTDWSPTSPASEQIVRSDLMYVVAVDIRCPGDDVTRMRKLFGLGAHLDAENRLESNLARVGTDRSFELRSAEAVKESAVHRSAVERAERASVGVGEDGFGAVLGDDLAEAGGDFVEGFIPTDALERHAGEGARATRTFWRYAFHRIEHTIGRVDAVQILGDFSAEKSARDRMLGITLNPGGASILDSDQHAACVRAIVRACGVDDALHLLIIESTSGIG